MVTRLGRLPSKGECRPLREIIVTETRTYVFDIPALIAEEQAYGIDIEAMPDAEIRDYLADWDHEDIVDASEDEDRVEFHVVVHRDCDDAGTECAADQTSAR